MNKPRRDITLGEMQDECKRNDANACGGCKCRDVCWTSNFNLHSKPKNWNLTDPTRFNEAQKAFWRGWHAMGAAFVRRWKDGNIRFVNEWGDDIGTINSSFDLVDILEIGETLDLAELLGKDGEK